MNRPIFIMVIGYIIGIIWGLYLKVSMVPFYIFLVIIYIIIQIPYSKKNFKIFSIKRYFRYIKITFKTNIILTIIISSFISNLIIKYKENQYDTLFKDGQEIELTAIVISNKQQKEYYNRYTIKTSFNKNLYINVNQELEYGDKIQIKGKYQEPQKARNYKGFDYKQYLKTLKIYGTIKVLNIKVIDKKCANEILQISNTVFLNIKSNIEKTYNKNISGIILGVMLGYTEQIDENIREDFSSSNISHVLAVSGMHISYIILLITNCTQKILGKRSSKIISSVLLVAYMFITGFSVSVVRASIMGILSCMSFIVYRKSDTLNNISISALLTLINNPYSIVGTSFLLTYGGSLGIIYFKPIVEKIIKNIKIRNRKWKYIFLKIQRKCEKIIEIVAVALSAQIVIAPIMILSFNTIGIGFLLTNLLLSCVIGIIVMGGGIQVLISFISIDFGISLAKLIEIPTYALLLISKINLGNFRVITPNFSQIILYYLLICLSRYFYIIFHSKDCKPTQVRIKNIIYLLKYKLRPYFKKISIIFICMIFIIIGIRKLPHDLEIYFIDVGQGDSTLIVTPNNKKILIDGGGSHSYDVGKNTLIPYLLDRKINKLDYVIISHFDQDHVGGILSILKEMKVEKVVIGKQGGISEQYNYFCEIIKKKQIQVVIVQKGDILSVDKDVKIRVLFPRSDLIQDNILNNNSLVFKLEYEAFKILFTGDIEEEAEEQLLKLYKNGELKADILKVAHHGSKTSSTEKFIKVLNSKIALIGVGQNNKFGHPNSTVINKFDELRCKSLQNR